MSYIIDEEQLPDLFPTQNHDPAFWEALGRTIATFGYLEDVMRRAIFFFTGTAEPPAEDVEAATDKWLEKLDQVISDPLGPLIREYIKAIRVHRCQPNADIDDLDTRLKQCARLRNALCHGSWGLPDGNNRSRLNYIEKRSGESMLDRIGVEFLNQTRTGTTELIVDVVNSVTILGYQFPGINGPGEIFWSEEQ
ncbi:hypothetical protein [Tranquillimonas rosea]|uniref:hypothetical protein n=1 Tax=Tranquillimonas rosea TaxID=641238 RepID=UPI003BAAF111